MWILTVFRVRECRCWGQLNYNQGLEREEKQFKNAAFCCISFWPEYRNVSRRISSIPGGWAVRRCYVCFVVFSTRNAVAGVSWVYNPGQQWEIAITCWPVLGFLNVELVYKLAFSCPRINFSSETVIWFLCCASFLSFCLLLLLSRSSVFVFFFLVLLSSSSFLFCEGLFLLFWILSGGWLIVQ